MTATKKQLKASSLKDLHALHRNVVAVIKMKQAQMRAARERILALAKRLGISVRDLTRLSNRRGPDKAPREAPQRARAAKMKHVNPKDTSQTWNGKGRPPLWFKKPNGAGSHATH